ncbi:uncharacterized protein [Acropora muricata]|uniref:uncharacterized protein n=1 Tax=Acropora muricata TaxID=159855 RepID=UPI0034E4BC0E
MIEVRDGKFYRLPPEGSIPCGRDRATSTMNYLAEALTGLDEDHDKRGSTIVEGENNMYYSAMNYLAEALTDPDEDHDKSESTTVEGENYVYYGLAQNEMTKETG